MTDWRNETRTCACGEPFKPRREKQTYCSNRCRNTAVVKRKRSGDRTGEATELPRSGDIATSDVPSGLSEGSTMVWPDEVHNLLHGSNPDGSTPGALQGDDYHISLDADGWPILPDCLRRKPRLTVAVSNPPKAKAA